MTSELMGKAGASELEAQAAAFLSRSFWKVVRGHVHLILALQ